MLGETVAYRRNQAVALRVLHLQWLISPSGRDLRNGRVYKRDDSHADGPVGDFETNGALLDSPQT